MRSSYRLIFSLLLLMAAASADALTLQCEPGKLESLLRGKTATDLVILGQMDARDFKTLSDRRETLRSLNLVGVRIVAHHSDKPLYANVVDYRANEVPTMALAQMTQLTTLTLPHTATSIGEGAMAACTKLTDVTLPQQLRFLGSYALAGCTHLETLLLPPLLQVVGDGALTGCSALTTVKPSGPMNPTASVLERQPCVVHTIGARAFAGCTRLKNLDLGQSIESIGEAAFVGTQVTQANLADMQSLTHIGDWAYAQTPITKALLPGSLRSLGWGAFLLTPQLQQVTMPASLSALPPLALAGSTHVSAVDLSETSIDSIGDYALYGLKQIDNLVIPSTVRYVGTQAMCGMTGLEQLVSHAGDVPDLGSDVWQGVDQASVTLKVPSHSVDKYRTAEQWCEFDIQSSAIAGDVNMDGTVDIADLNLCINYMLGHMPSVFDFDACDVSANGNIDIADINGIINIMLGRYLSLPSTSTPNTGDMLAMDNFAITAGERHTIDVRLKGSRAYTAMQCVIHLPEGLVPVGQVMVGSRAVDHSVASLTSGNEVRIVVYNLTNSNISDDTEQPIVRLTVTATDRLAPLSQITVDHVAMTTATGEAYYLPPTVAQVSHTTGLAEPSKATDRVYAANGTLCIVAAEAGSAQLVSLSGMTRTLHVTQGSNSYHNIDPGVYVVRLNGHSYKIKI